MAQIKCIKSVVIANGDKKGEVAFTEGKEYRTYRYLMPDGYKKIPTTAAKNDWGERHIIKSEKMDDFFNEHFISA
jgi:hypothetical protein